MSCQLGASLVHLTHTIPLCRCAQVFLARHLATFDNKHAQMGHLMQAQRLRPFVDVAFLVYQARRNVESAAGAASTSALSRVAFDKWLGDARRYVHRAAAAQSAFWAHLLEPTVSMSHLHKLTQDMAQSASRAEAAFKELFALQSGSLAALRLFSQYHHAVTNNQDKATELAAEADRLEEARTKEWSQHSGMVSARVIAGSGHRSFAMHPFPPPYFHGMQSSHFGLRVFTEVALDLTGDNVAVLQIGATSGTLGLVQSTNTFCCRLFGFSRSALMHRNMKVLLPSPIAGEGVISGTGCKTATSPPAALPAQRCTTASCSGTWPRGTGGSWT